MKARVLACGLDLKVSGASSDAWITNSHWAGRRRAFEDTIRGQTTKGLHEKIEALIPEKRTGFMRTPLMWKTADGNAVCYVSAAGVRRWVREEYAFEENLFGPLVEKPAGSTLAVDFIFMPFSPPDDEKLSELVLAGIKRTSKQAVAAAVAPLCAARGCSNPTKAGKHCSKHTAGSANEPYESEAVGKKAKALHEDDVSNPHEDFI